MNLYQFMILGTIGFILVFILIIFIIFRKNILSFFNPNDWVIIEMNELDNTSSSWIQEKNPNLQFMFNKGYYNMFIQDLDEQGNLIRRNSPYREGRLVKFCYNEGNSDPLDFRTGKITGNPQINRQLEETKIDSWFEEDESVASMFFKKYGLLIVGIIIVLMVLYFIFGPKQQAVQTAQTVKPVVTGG